MLRPDALNIFTDASLYRSEKKGGIGAIFVYFGEDGISVEVAMELQGYKSSTINQMELQAVILAIEKIKAIDYSSRVNRAVIFTDSLYVVDNYPRARYEWSQNKWCNKDGKPMAYASQWKALLKAIKASKMRVDFHWIKGHSGNSYHNHADKKAKASAKGLLQPSLQVTDIRRKKTQLKTELGSVGMDGQRMTIRIVICEYQKEQKVFKLHYEVMSKKSKYYGLADVIFSSIALRTGHSYLVTVNDNIDNPRIVKMIREVAKTPSSNTTKKI